MPCRGPETYDELTPGEIKAMGGVVGAQLSMLRGQRDAVYAALCEACGLAGDEIISEHGSENLKEWWAHHKQQDARRKAREAKLEEKRVLRQQALAKLSAEEREALGLR